MSELAEKTKVCIDGIEWDRFDYGGFALLQRKCDAGCDDGLLLAPARFCPKCGGNGTLVEEESAAGPLTEGDAGD